jgi:ABC-2 type transport system ATP-binding protein
MQKAIEVQNLHKAFGEIRAVDGGSFSVERGEIFSLLGPNGAGKTTTISMLSCLLRPDQGDATVMGHSIRKDPMGVKSVLGVVPQEIALYEDLTARENLNFWGKMYGLRGAALNARVDEVLEVIGLTDRAKDRVGKYSGGMKRRVNIGVALLHKPQVIYMDEPTVGIDPQSRRSILDNVITLKNQGMTVLYTTHYMEEAQRLCDRVAILDHGKMLVLDKVANLIAQHGGTSHIEIGLNEVPQDQAGLAARLGASELAIEGNTIRFQTTEPAQALATLNQCGVRYKTLKVDTANLEDVFLNLTGRRLRD